MIKKRSDVKVHVSPAQAWQIVIDILHWVADNSDVLKISKCLVIVEEGLGHEPQQCQSSSTLILIPTVI